MALQPEHAFANRAIINAASAGERERQSIATTATPRVRHDVRWQRSQRKPTPGAKFALCQLQFRFLPALLTSHAIAPGFDTSAADAAGSRVERRQYGVA